MKKFYLILLILISISSFAKNTYFDYVYKCLNNNNHSDAQIYLDKNSSLEKTNADYLAAKAYYLSVKAVKSKELTKKNKLIALEDALVFIEKSIKLDGSSSISHYVKGKNLMLYAYVVKDFSALNKITDARDSFFKSIELDKNNFLPLLEVPGIYANMPQYITFGNKTYAVSYGRKLLQLRGEKKDYIQFASILAKRNWSANKRAKELPNIIKQYNETSNYLDKLQYFEGANESFAIAKSYGVNDIYSISDLDEALVILKKFNVNRAILDGENAWDNY